MTAGVLPLLHAGDPGPTQLPALAPGDAAQIDGHVLLAAPNGRYFVLGEMIEAKGGYGTEAAARAIADRQPRRWPIAHAITSA